MDGELVDFVDLLKRTTNISSMGVHVVDLKTREMYYSNEAGFRLIGVEPCDYQGRTCHDTFFHSNNPCKNCRLEQTKLGKQKHEVYVPEADKTFLTHSEIADWNGKQVYIEYITDISDSKQEEERLRYNEQLIQEKYELEKRRGLVGDDSILAHSIYNLSTRTPVEFKLEKLIQPDATITQLQKLAELESVLIVEEEQVRQFLSLHKEETLLAKFEAGETEVSMEIRCKLPDGRVRWVRDVLHMLRKPKGNDILLFEYTYDINKSKSMDIMMEFAVNDEYDLIGSVNFIDNEAVMLYGQDSYNIYDEALVEEDYNTSLNRFARNAIVPEEQEAYLAKANIENIREVLKNQTAYEFYFHMIKNGIRKTKRVRYISYGAQKDVCLFIQNDITNLLAAEQKKQNELQEALESAKLANHYKSTFLSQMSHEIRTPMNAIIGMASLAKDSGDIAQKDGYIEKIESSSQFLLGIINDILDMSRIENGKFELHPKWNLGQDMLLSCIDMLQPAMQKKKIKFIYPELKKSHSVEYYVDELRMRQIYMNLLNNAMKFTPEGGTITLSVKNLEYDERFSTDQITISDTGCGMSEAFLKRIFEPFEQEQNPYSSLVQGTGLGLALVKQILTAMGGEISVESKLGEGSTFTFTIPYEYRCATEEAPIEQPKEKISLTGKRILLAEDHPLNREIATKLLEKQGILVKTAKDGAEAVEQFKQSQTGHFDMILMDIRMPNLNGLQATGEIRKLQRTDAATIPIIAMTANAFDDDVRISLEAGMNDHLAKPIEVEKMFATIRKWI